MLLRHLQYLIAVVDHGNFTRAAQALHVSQPTLSQQIRQLEDRLGAQLLDRSGRAVHPTDAGLAYLAHARRALTDLAAAERAVHDVHDLSRGSLRLAMTPTFTAYLVGPAIALFRARYPALTVHIHEMALDAIGAALAEDVVDLGIAFSPLDADDVSCQELFSEKLSVMVGSGHPLARRKQAMTCAELEREPLALLAPGFATRDFVNGYLQAQGIRPSIVVEANTINALVEIVRRGGMATILPDAITRDHPALRSVALTPALPQRTVALLWRKDSYQSAAARAFAGLMDELVRQLPQPA